MVVGSNGFANGLLVRSQILVYKVLVMRFYLRLLCPELRRSH
jgi:hypothetical protein